MKHGKSLFAIGALAACLSPTAAFAATGEDGFEACVSALVQDLSDAQGFPLQATISEDTAVANNRLNRRNRFYLDVRDPASREIVAKIDCIVNKQAEVVELLRLPEDAPVAEVRSL
jgi:hypothetical protein